MIAQGHDPEDVDKALTWFFAGAELQDWVSDLLANMTEALQRAAKSIEECWQQIKRIRGGFDERLPEDVEKLPRPPRYVGPVKYSTKRQHRPARVARSSCRKK
jgi:hypothetical protein